MLYFVEEPFNYPEAYPAPVLENRWMGENDRTVDWTSDGIRTPELPRERRLESPWERERRRRERDWLEEVRRLARKRRAKILRRRWWRDVHNYYRKHEQMAQHRRSRISPLWDNFGRLWPIHDYYRWDLGLRDWRDVPDTSRSWIPADVDVHFLEAGGNWRNRVARMCGHDDATQI